MPVHILLAHGSLGNWDEVIFLSVAAVFLIMMGISWIRSRSNVPDEEAVPPTAPAAPESDSQDHFPLS